MPIQIPRAGEIHMKNEKNLLLDSCAWFAQLPSGHWGGDAFSGWKVSMEAFKKGERPDRFKFEPARRATEEEARAGCVRKPAESKG